MRPGAALGDSVATPASLEAIPLSLHLNVGALAVHGVRGGEVVEGDQQVQVPLSLKLPLTSQQQDTSKSNPPQLSKNNWFLLTGVSSSVSAAGLLCLVLTAPT